MASISVPSPNCSVVAEKGARSRNYREKTSSLDSLPKLGSARFHSARVAVEIASTSSPFVSTKPETLTAINKADVIENSSCQDIVTYSTISALIAEVSSLVKLVDSKDITELHLKKEGCELIIRKREAFPQPPVSAIPITMQYPPTMFPVQPYASAATTPVSINPVPAVQKPALPPASPGSKSSLPPLKSPMAGTFYRSPAPGEPPFVKVGDKVQKGQVVCIIEAMKLMNEIEADKSGTIVDILAEDGKPVSFDAPLLIIQP